MGKSIDELKAEIEVIMSTPEGRARLGTLLRANFKQYIMVIFLFCFDAQFVFKPFHEEIIQALQDIADRRNKKRNLMLNLPYGAGKSLLLELFISWTFARNKNISYVYTSSSIRLIEALSSETRDVIQSDIYHKLFEIELKIDNKSKLRYAFKGSAKRTGLLAAPISAKITGVDAGNPNIKEYNGALIIDEPLDADTVKHAVERESAIYIYNNKLKTRRRNSKTPTIIVGHRLHKGDLCAYVEENEGNTFNIIKVKALNDDDTSFWEERKPASEFIDMRDNPATYASFMSLCQQEPIESENQVIDTSWFNTYMVDDMRGVKFTKTFIVADTAMKIKEAHDYSVFMVCGLYNRNLYILDMARGKWESPELLRKAKEIYSRWNTAFNYRRLAGVYIEDKASGTGLIQQLKQMGMPVMGIKTKRRDKLERLEDVLTHIANGRVYLPSDRPFNKEIIRECMEFQRDMKHKHDDIVDVLVYSCMVGFTGVASTIFNGMC